MVNYKQMEKIKEYFHKYKFEIIGATLLIIFYFIYENFKDKIFNNTDDKNQLEVKIDEVKKEKKDKNLQIIKNEIQQLNDTINYLKPDFLNKKEEYLTELFKKNINRKGLLIDSVSLTKQGDHDTSNYKINFGSNETPEVYKNVIGFRLVKATLPNTSYQVTETNNTFSINYYNNNDSNQGSSSTPITLEKGNYTFQSFAEMVQRVINTTISGLGVSITPNLVNFKYRITSDNPFAFDWGDSHVILLFGANSDSLINLTTGAVDFTFPNVVNQTKHFVDLVIPEIPHIACKTSSKGKQIIDRIPLTGASGSLIYYLAPVTEYSSIDYFYPIKLSSLTIQLYDNDTNHLYDSQNGDNYFEFELTLLKNTDKMN